MIILEKKEFNKLAREIETLELDDSEKRAIFAGNAKRLFSL